MKKNIDYIRDNLGGYIKSQNLIGLMSDSKWVKLIQTLVINSSIVKQVEVKLIWDEPNIKKILHIDEDTSYRFDYYDKSMEAMISGNPKGWVDYKEIEWLYFPKTINKDNGEQNVELIESAIKKIGKFKIEVEENGMKLLAYLRQKSNQ